jgi:transglutaminase-like putative cysteine protease
MIQRLKWGLFAATLLGWLLRGEFARAAEDYSIGAPPAWVRPVAVPTDRLGAIEPVSGGIHYLLSDNQLRVDDVGTTSFVHAAYEIANKAGLDNWSDLSIDFDPSFQHVVLNEVVLLRGDRRIDELKAARIQIYQRETNLDQQSYNGARTIHLLFDDVRIGDVVEYSFVVSGENPALRGSLARTYDLQWDIAVDRASLRILWDKKSRPLRLRRIQSAPEPLIATGSGGTEYSWSRRDTTPLIREPQIPSWYQAYTGVELSDAQSWAEVAERATALFAPALSAPTPSLKAVAEKLRRAGSTPESQIVAALRFVQKTIRYVAISVGTGGYKPNPAALTLARKYGDCKDKTVLLVSLLHLLGFEAYPVLVNTDMGFDLKSRLPALTAFDHVIAFVPLKGKVHWLDPTLNDQEGDLDHGFEPDYGWGLVLASGTDGLTERRSAPLGAPTFVVARDLDLSHGPNNPGIIRITSIYSGRDADWMRHRLSLQTVNEIQNDHVEYYARRYSDPRALGPIEIKRDDVTNRIELNESYEIGQPWHSEDAEWRADYELGALRAAFDEIGNIKRKAPFAITHPIFREERMTLQLPPIPKGWHTEAETERIANEFFALDYDHTMKGRTSSFIFRYRTLRSSVPPDRLAAYKKDMERAVGLTGNYYASFDRAAAASAPWIRWGWVLGALLIWIGAAYVTRRFRRKPVSLPSRPLAIYRISLDK